MKKVNRSTDLWGKVQRYQGEFRLGRPPGVMTQDDPTASELSSSGGQEELGGLTQTHDTSLEATPVRSIGQIGHPRGHVFTSGSVPSSQLLDSDHLSDGT